MTEGASAPPGATLAADDDRHGSILAADFFRDYVDALEAVGLREWVLSI